MARCKRSLSVTRHVLAAASPGTTITITADTVAFVLRAVSSAGAPVAFTVAAAGDPAAVFTFDAGDAFTVENLKLDGDLELRVDSATATDVAELLTWSA